MSFRSRSLRRWKYETLADYAYPTKFEPESELTTRHGWVSIQPDGRLVIQKGYAWDGPSGPTIDTENFMRGSLVHDALYQLFREGKLDPEKQRE